MRKQTRGRGALELALTVAVAIGLAFCVQAYAVKPYRIPSASMEPTLHEGDRVLVNRFSHRLGAEPQVGQVVVFHPPRGADLTPARCGVPVSARSACPTPTSAASEQTFIKRVVGVGGDRIAVAGGHVLRNGARESDSYIAPCGGGEACDLPRTITVPSGYVFLMGDNRGNSDDSRFWGPVPLSWVIGQAVSIYWPPDRVGTL
ncbi:MAG: signal peptidase I [Solirubrobacteraceae bacterium]